MLSGNKDTMTEMLTGQTGIVHAQFQPGNTLDLITNYIQPLANKVPQSLEFIGRIGGSTYTYGDDVIHNYDAINGYHLVSIYPDDPGTQGQVEVPPVVSPETKQTILGSILTTLFGGLVG